jgi:DNA ligase-associated metallophosphoesterase
MNGHDFRLAGSTLTAFGSGALWWAERRLLCVSDLHLGKSDRVARRSGTLLPPYETQETLARLEKAIQSTNATTIVCLGDSFDDAEAEGALDEAERLWLARMQAGRRWIWIAGNHDPGPIGLGGSHLAEYHAPPLSFRHIAKASASGEISGHFHPKTRVNAKGRSVTRACFLIDRTRAIMPAFGTYTGGLRATAQVLQDLMKHEAMAILTGPSPRAVPMPRT